MTARIAIEAIQNFHGKSAIEWAPFPGPQTDALNSLADVLFFGGAAGGGKSDLLIGASLTRHHKSIIYRREFTQLRDIEERIEAICGTAGRYNHTTHVLRLPGRIVELGAVQYEKDVEKYMGRPHDLKAFDEVQNFLEQQFRFLSGWTRTSIPGQRTRIIAAGNPPTTSEGEWVIQYWAPWLDEEHPNPARTGELRWFAMIGDKEVEVESGAPVHHDGEVIIPQSRTFIPARVEDNPVLMATGYKIMLQALPEPLRSKYLFGKFEAVQGEDPMQLIPTSWVEAAMQRWRQDGRPGIPMSRLGVDVARGGKAKTCLAARYGTWFDQVEKHPGAETPDGPSVAALVLKRVIPTTPVGIDVIGIGSAAYDACKAGPILAVPLNGSEKSDATDRTRMLRFRNKRAEWHWKMRELLDPQYGEEIALPLDRELKADLCAPRWKLTVSGIQVEEKDDIIARLGRSPDVGEAVIYASIVVPSVRMMGSFGRPNVRQQVF